MERIRIGTNIGIVWHIFVSAEHSAKTECGVAGGFIVEDEVPDVDAHLGGLDNLALGVEKLNVRLVKPRLGVRRSFHLDKE